VGGARLCLGNHPADLLQLVHQVGLRRQAPCRVGDHHVAAARLAGNDRVERHGRRVPTLLAHDLDLIASRPDRELLTRCRTERVGRGQQDLLVRVCEVAREFADARRFARPVDAHDHDHRGHVFAHRQRLLQRLQQICQGIRQKHLHRDRVSGLGFLDAAFQVGQQELGGLDTRIGHQQGSFKLLIKRIVDFGTGEHLGDARPGLAQAASQFVDPATALQLRECSRQRWRRVGRRSCVRFRRERHAFVGTHTSQSVEPTAALGFTRRLANARGVAGGLRRGQGCSCGCGGCGICRSGRYRFFLEESEHF